MFTAVTREKPHNAAEDFYSPEPATRFRAHLIAGLLLGVLLFLGGLDSLRTLHFAVAPDKSISLAKNLYKCVPGLFSMTLGAILVWKIAVSFKNSAFQNKL